MRGTLGELGFPVFCVAVFGMALCESVVDLTKLIYCILWSRILWHCGKGGTCIDVFLELHDYRYKQYLQLATLHFSQVTHFKKNNRADCW